MLIKEKEAPASCYSVFLLQQLVSAYLILAACLQEHPLLVACTWALSHTSTCYQTNKPEPICILHLLSFQKVCRIYFFS